MSDCRVIHRVEPYPHEDVIGFLMRVATRNSAGGPGELLARVTGSPTASVDIGDMQELAQYCRLTAHEAASVSGIVRRGAGQAIAWRIADEWITKSAFVAPHRAKICPRCLAEYGYIPGIWALTFYTVCAEHGLQLVTCCPSCKRALKWERRHVGRCGCGCDLTQAANVSVDGAPAWLASLIARRTEMLPSALLGSTDVASADCLLDLSLDGLFKVVWFLGHCIGDLDHCHVAHGHAQPDIEEAQGIARRAFALLHDWPRCLAAELAVLVQRTASNTSASLLDRVLGPAQYYLREEMQAPEVAPFASAYEHIVSGLWRMAGYRCRSMDGSRQLQLALS